MPTTQFMIKLGLMGNLQRNLTSERKCPYMTGVPSWQVSLHDRCPYMTGVPTWQVSLHDRCPFMTGVPTWQVSLHDRCPYMTGVPTWQVSLHDRCPYMTGVPTWRVTIHDRCPYMTGVHTWQVSLYDRCPYMTGVHTWQVSLHDRCPYMTGVPSSQDPVHGTEGDTILKKMSPGHCPLKIGLLYTWHNRLYQVLSRDLASVLFSGHFPNRFPGLQITPDMKAAQGSPYTCICILHQPVWIHMECFLGNQKPSRK